MTTPAHLGAAGRKLWTDTVKDFDLRPDELRILEDACREADLVDRLEEALRDSDLMVKGSQGQPVASPLVTEVRQHRATFAQLMGKLKLVDDETEREARSVSARAAANARWRRGA